jgi:hypothetical protein
MSLRVAASGDARALAIRDHVMPLVRAHGTLEDLEDKNSTLRLVVLEHGPWRFTHWTPFNSLGPTEASSPGYRHALERQRTRPDLPYGLEIWHEGTKVLSLLWADEGSLEIVELVRGNWEEAALAFRP